MSMIVPLVRGLKHTLKLLKETIKVGEAVKTNLSENIIHRLCYLENYKLGAKATFLDPRFKMVGFGLTKNANEAEKWVADERIVLIEKQSASFNHNLTTSPQMSSSSNTDIWTHFDEKLAKSKSHSVPTSVGILNQNSERTECLILFWKKHTRHISRIVYIVGNIYVFKVLQFFQRDFSPRQDK